ncbi:MAG TPA: twin-arginine translocase TatA/TatE family subunit [Candidatus Limnocylindrales bacterium]|nr:twin-arginine translocase TatA/TatE family subunit [Candidatus Limnocylindrales bacterium]
MPFNIGPLELIVVLVIALLVLGPGKLPEVGSALGKSIREFRKAATDVQDAARIDAPAAPAAPAAGAAPTATPVPTSPTSADAAHPVGESPSTVPSPAPNTLSNQKAPNEISTEPKG